jgi:hypothetical protein
MSKLNTMAMIAHANSIEKGFWDVDLHDNHFLMLVVTELSEAVEADRKNRIANLIHFEELINVESRFKKGKMYATIFKNGFEKLIKDSTADELSDAYIRLLDLGGARGCKLKVKNHQVDGGRFEVEKNTFCENIFAITGLITSQSYASLDSKISYAIGDIRTMAMFYEIDIDKHIEYKMQYNSTRERMHGKMY